MHRSRPLSNRLTLVELRSGLSKRQRKRKKKKQKTNKEKKKKKKKEEEGEKKSGKSVPRWVPQPAPPGLAGNNILSLGAAALRFSTACNRQVCVFSAYEPGSFLGRAVFPWRRGFLLLSLLSVWLWFDCGSGLKLEEKASADHYWWHSNLDGNSLPKKSTSHAGGSRRRPPEPAQFCDLPIEFTEPAHSN